MGTAGAGAAVAATGKRDPLPPGWVPTTPPSAAVSMRFLLRISRNCKTPLPVTWSVWLERWLSLGSWKRDEWHSRKCWNYPQSGSLERLVLFPTGPSCVYPTVTM
ncbi:unnamed protein product, partial [Phaeothamnion confervicola]